MRHKLKALLDKITNAGVKIDTSFEEQKKIRLLNRILLLYIIRPVTSSITLFFIGFYPMIYLDLVICFTLVLALFFNYKNQVGWGKLVFLIIMPLLVSIYPIFQKDIGIEFYYFIFIVIGFYILDKKEELVVLSFYLIILSVLPKLIAVDYSFPGQEKLNYFNTYYLNLISSILIIIFSIYIFKKDTLKYQSVIEGQSKELGIRLIELERKDKLSFQLMKELNHRVKNNLQMMSSLFTMQIYQHKNEEIRYALYQAKHRIDTIAILHQHLYKTSHLEAPNLKKYIEELSAFVLQSSGMSDQIELETNINEIFLKTEVTIHIGLIINELLTNAFKYGVTGDKLYNKVSISIKKRLKRIEIIVTDSGLGFPKDYKVSNTSSSFGLGLVNDIAQQYDGSFEFDNLNGAQVRVMLKIAC